MFIVAIEVVLQHSCQTSCRNQFNVTQSQESDLITVLDILISKCIQLPCEANTEFIYSSLAVEVTEFLRVQGMNLGSNSVCSRTGTRVLYLYSSDSADCSTALCIILCLGKSFSRICIYLIWFLYFDRVRSIRFWCPFAGRMTDAAQVLASLGQGMSVNAEVVLCDY